MLLSEAAVALLVDLAKGPGPSLAVRAARAGPLPDGGAGAGAHDVHVRDRPGRQRDLPDPEPRLHVRLRRGDLGTGVCMNNFLNWGIWRPIRPIALSPRSFGMCLAPSVSTRNGEAVLALGTPGSYGICQTQSRMVHHVEYGLIFRRRSMRRAPALGRTPGAIESRVEDAVSEDLLKRGHDLEMINPSPCPVAACTRSAGTRKPAHFSGRRTAAGTGRRFPLDEKLRSRCGNLDRSFLWCRPSR